MWDTLYIRTSLIRTIRIQIGKNIWDIENSKEMFERYICDSSRELDSK